MGMMALTGRLWMTRGMETALAPSGLRQATLVLATVTGLSHWTMVSRRENSAGTPPARDTSTSTALCSLAATEPDHQLLLSEHNAIKRNDQFISQCLIVLAI